MGTVKMLFLLNMAGGTAFLGTALYPPTEAFITLLIRNWVTQTKTGCFYFLQLYFSYQNNNRKYSSH